MKGSAYKEQSDKRREYAITENPYQSLVVDITSRCNMTCNYCYNPMRSPRDMSLDDFRFLCANLPFPVALKLAGGEPTLHPQILDFMRVGHEHGHTVYIISNGARYSDKGFMNSLRELKKAGTAFSLGLSMDGGYANRRAYEAINGRDCMQEKLAAFDSLVSYGMGRVCLTAIVVRGLNEDVIPQLITLANDHKKAVRYIHLRNASKVGVWLDSEPYSLHEIKALVGQYFSEEEFEPKCVKELFCPPGSGNECCYRFRPTERLQISLVEFNSERSAKCPKRGRLKMDSLKIQPFFESMR
jgi:molybdenum cofactor biosynthesis enzyme MoaA